LTENIRSKGTEGDVNVRSGICSDYRK
jgi:hypothetical protein